MSATFWSGVLLFAATFCGLVQDARCTVFQIDATLPANSTSGCASRRSVTRWPGARRPASASSTFPSARIVSRSGSSITSRERQTVSPTLGFVPSQFVT